MCYEPFLLIMEKDCEFLFLQVEGVDSMAVDGHRPVATHCDRRPSWDLLFDKLFECHPIPSFGLMVGWYIQLVC